MRTPTITAATRDKRILAAVTAIRKRHARDGDARTQAHDGARVGDWTMLSTDGSTAILTRTSAPTIDRDDSSVLRGTPRAAVVLPDLVGPIKRCLPLAPERSKALWLAADVDRVWVLTFGNSDQEWAREWTPAAFCAPAAPVCFNARYLLEAYKLLAPAGEPVTWVAHDRPEAKVPVGPTLFVSADQQWAYLVMPMDGDTRAAEDLIPRLTAEAIAA